MNKAKTLMGIWKVISVAYSIMLMFGGCVDGNVLEDYNAVDSKAKWEQLEREKESHDFHAYDPDEDFHRETEPELTDRYDVVYYEGGATVVSVDGDDVTLRDQNNKDLIITNRAHAYDVGDEVNVVVYYNGRIRVNGGIIQYYH